MMNSFESSSSTDTSGLTLEQHDALHRESQRVIALQEQLIDFRIQDYVDNLDDALQNLKDQTALTQENARLRERVAALEPAAKAWFALKDDLLRRTLLSDFGPDERFDFEHYTSDNSLNEN